MNKKNFLIIANFLIANRQKSGPDHLQLSRSDSITVPNSLRSSNQGLWIAFRCHFMATDRIRVHQLDWKSRKDWETNLKKSLTIKMTNNWKNQEIAKVMVSHTLITGLLLFVRVKQWIPLSGSAILLAYHSINYQFVVIECFELTII